MLFLIIEITNTQTLETTLLKSEKYVEDAYKRISTIVILKINSKSQFETQLSIWKTYRESIVKKTRSSNFVTKFSSIVKNLEIYSNFDSTKLVLKLTLQDLFLRQLSHN